jgi:hypothetical protein
VTNFSKKLEISNLATKFGSAGQPITEANLITTYAKDIEEMIKGVMISGKDTY